MSTRWKSWSLQQAMIAAVITLSLIPALLIGAFTLYGHLRTIGEFENKSIQNAVTRLGTDIESHLHQAVQVMDMMVDNTSTSATTNRQALKWLDDPNSFEPTAFALSRSLKTVPKVYFGVEDNGNYFSVEHSAQEGYVSVRSNTDIGTRDFRAEFAGDQSQQVRMEDRMSFEPRTEPWYKYATKKGKRAFTPVFSEELRYAELMTSLVQPVYNDADQLAGVFGVDLQLRGLSDLLKKEKVSENGVAYIIDEQGALVASSVYEPIVSVNVDIMSRLNASHSNNHVIRDSFLALLSAEKSQTNLRYGTHQAGKVQRMEAQNGEQLVVTTTPLAHDLGLNWNLIVAAPAEDFAKTFNENLFTSTAIAVGLALLTAILATVAAFRIGKDFKRFAIAARSLGEGRLPEFESSRFSEMRALQEVMNKSARQLKNYRLELKRQAIELEVTNLNLEMRVQTRTAQLEASRQAALTAAKAKSAFLATMSHEIRTPLNGVLGMATLLEETNLTPEQKDYLRTMQVSGDQLLNIINDVLDFSKIESGKLDLEKEPLNLQDAVEEACEIAALKAREKHIPVHIVMDESVPIWVAGDITRLRQILLNFLNNAVKFTHEGEINVTVSAVDDDSSNSLIEFRVRDTGIGIPTERQEALFQSFSQVDASTTRKYGGTGLGLAICKRLAETMGGGVGVESEEGAGSTFWFTARLPEVQAPASLDNQLNIESLKGKVAVIVDDNLSNLKILADYLKQWNIETQAFSAAEDAIAYLKKHPVDVVLTDLHMPEVDGIELIKRMNSYYLSKNKEQPKIIILASSVLAINRSEVNFDAKLLKPYRKNQLKETLLRAMRTVEERHHTTQDAHTHENQYVLVADDNAVNLKVANAMLRKLGYVVSTAVDGRQAVDMVAESLRPGHHPFSIVLMDLNMPNMDGIEATKLILETFGKAAPPIIALTASVLEEDIKRCESAGMVDFLPKPLELKNLSEVLSRWVALMVTSAPPELPVAKATPTTVKQALTAPSSDFTDTHTASEQAPVSSTPGSTLFDSDFTEEVKQKLMNWTRLRDFAEFDDEELSMTREVIAAFINDCPFRLDDIEAQLEAVNSAELSRAAHALKGAASNIGAAALNERCYALEQSCLQGKWPDNAAKQVKRIRALGERTTDALKQWLATGEELDDDTNYSPLA